MTRFYRTFDNKHIPVSVYHVLSKGFFPRDYLSFERARVFVRKLKLKNLREWQIYCKSGNKPNNIPNHPCGVYKDWINWADFLGTKNFTVDWLSFARSRAFVRKLKLMSSKEWKAYCKSGNKPYNIPVAPNQVYKNKGWVSWGDFLATKRIATNYRQYKTFKEARSFVKKLKLENVDEWIKYSKSSKKPDDIPASPRQVYKNQGWISWPDFLGTKR